MTKLKYKFALLAVLLIGLIYLLSLVFSGKIVLPQFFAIGPLQIHYYGVIMAAAVLAGYFLARKRAEQYGLSLKLADDLIFWTVLGGFAGARIYHVLSSAPYYWHHPLDVFKVWNGGLSIFGAVLGGFLGLLILKKLYASRFTLYDILDWLAPSVILGQIIGRLGNLFNYEAFGYPTGLPWKMFVPVQFRPLDLVSIRYYHPLFLYELLGNAIILFFLLKKFKNMRPGTLFFTYLLLYNVLRFFLEFLRVDSTFIWGLRLNVIASGLLAITAAAVLYALKKRHGQIP